LRQAYFLFPLVIWAAVRFGPRGAAATTLALSAIAIGGTALGFGPFLQPALHERLALLQPFMGVLAVTALVLAAVTSERDAAARQHAASEHKLSVLAQAGAVLASSLDFETTLQNVARR